jgi:geranylgeranyl transferase type-2 subunit beta
MCFELLGLSIPEPDRMRAFVLGRRRDDGGFVEVAPMRKSGTNPTAAAIGILDLLSGIRYQESGVRNQESGVSEEQIGATVDFLAGMVSMEGGLRANERIPLADALSTFTGSWTLAQLGALDRLDANQVRGFILAIQDEAGGFRGGLWDEAADVEYTFYGLGTLALFASSASVEA